MQKKNITIAIIDNGVYENRLEVTKKLKSYDVTKNGEITVRTSKDILPDEKINHGTICAHIINSIMPDLHTTDIKIMEKDTGEVKNLIVALEWCYDNHISIINISMGTLNYHDYDKMKTIIKRLTQNGIIIVAAMSNEGLKSFPAFCKHVFAVRTIGKGMTYSYYLTAEEKRPIEKRVVVSYNDYIKDKRGNSIKIGYANSYAAPALSGKIAQMINENSLLNYYDILHYFSEEFPLIEDSRKWEKLNDSEKKCNVDIPVIEISDNMIDIMPLLSLCIEQHGYHAEFVSDYESTIKIIPASFYCENQALNSKILKQVEWIYKPDLLIICLNKEHIPPKAACWELVDVLIGNENEFHFMKTKNNIVIFDSYKEISEAIIQYFTFS